MKRCFSRLTFVCTFGILGVYMNTAVINVKVQPKMKKQAQAVASSLGFSLSALIKAYLKQLVKTKTVNFSASEEEPTEYLLESLRESREDIKAGRVVSFENGEGAIKYLHGLIKNERKSSKKN